MLVKKEVIYSASWGRLTRVMTFITMGLSLLPFAIVLVLSIIYRGHGAAVVAILLLVTLVIPLLITAIVVRSSPRRYTIAESEVLVNRLGRNIVIPCNSIEEVQLIDGHDVFSHSVRSNASGGYFGFFGSFSSPGMGGRDFTAYATRIDGLMVVLKLKHGDPVVLSPDSPETFVKSLQQKLDAS